MSNDEPHLLGGGDRIVDHGRTIALAAAGAIPILGAAAAGALELAWPSRWQNRVERLLYRVQPLLDGINASALERDDVATAVALALRSAVVSTDDKITYLANAVANVAKHPDIWEHDTVVILMRTVDQLTATHFRVLDLLVDPTGWITRTGVLLDQQPGYDNLYRLTDDITRALQQAGIASGDTALVLGDLEALGLLNAVGFGAPEAGTPRPSPLSPELVTTLGHRVHLFVTAPTPDE